MGMRNLMEAQVAEMLRHKWIESEKAGHDLGDACMMQWIRDHAADFRRTYNREHMSRLDDGRAVESVCVYPDCASIEEMVKSASVPEGWELTDCHFCLPMDKIGFVVDQLGSTIRVMVSMVGYAGDGIYVAGVVEGCPMGCVALVAVPADGSSGSEVEWTRVAVDRPVEGILDTCPRQFE